MRLLALVEVVLERVLVVDVRAVVVVVAAVVEVEVLLLVGPGELLDESGCVLGVLEKGRDGKGEVFERYGVELEDGVATLDNIEVDEAKGDPTIDEDIVDAVELDGPTDAVLPVLGGEVE